MNSTSEISNLARRDFMLLTALFISALITCNLIANKFITIDLGFKQFVISAGVLPYPITFLITDILSEIYGKKKTQEVVVVGFAAAIFTLFILALGGWFNAIPNSVVSDEVYNQVFKNSWRLIGASMAAYIVAQLVDVKLFHFWKRLTKGRMLWVRNNFSTIFSQLVDTILVVSIIFIGRENFSTITQYIIDGWIFKVIIAAFDTPFFYAAVYWYRKKYAISNSYQEVDF
ncbi:MAG: queuosine precursor transporter [Thermaurantimonas sp.]|uniref:queuosine precursor transporter n=1 Tax=Thermaurantimonas sp. TaxID=2681568 RepID=UPI00391AA379